MTSRRQHASETGATYVEVLIAAMVMATALVPAINALSTGLLGSDIAAEMGDEHYAALSLMEDVLAESWPALMDAAAEAGARTTPTTYSDAALTPSQRTVFIARYDASDADNDGDPFTVPDANEDGDNNPFTDYDGILWVKVSVRGSLTAFETLTLR